MRTVFQFIREVVHDSCLGGMLLYNYKGRFRIMYKKKFGLRHSESPQINIKKLKEA